MNEEPLRSQASSSSSSSSSSLSSACSWLLLCYCVRNLVHTLSDSSTDTRSQRKRPGKKALKSVSESAGAQ